MARSGEVREMRSAEAELPIVRKTVTGERLDSERVMSRSGGGRGKRGHATSPAAYPTACAVLRGRGGGDTSLLPGGCFHRYTMKNRNVGTVYL